MTNPRGGGAERDGARGGGDGVPRDEPVFQISVVARMVGIHQQTLRTYERMGLVEPHRTPGNRRLYSHRDVARLNQLRRLIEDLGVNLAGAEVILRLNRQIEELQREREAVHSELAELRAEVRELERRYASDRDARRTEPGEGPTDSPDPREPSA